MSVDCCTRSIDELCQVHARLAAADCLFINQEIDAQVFISIGENVSPDMSKLLATNNDLEPWRQGKHQHCFESLLIHEQAYQLLECSMLDFSTKTVRGDKHHTEFHAIGPLSYGSRGLVSTPQDSIHTQRVLHDKHHTGLYVSGPPVYCSHYNDCKGYIMGPNHEVEYSSDILPKDAKVSLSNEGYKRLIGRPVNVKIFKESLLVIEGRKGFNIFMHAWDIRPDPTIEGNMCIVRKMFSVGNGIPPESDCNQGVVSVAHYMGDMSSRKAMIKAMRANHRLRGSRPFILRSCVRTDRVLWLMGLVRNLEVSYDANVGILCRDSQTAQRIKNELDHFKIESACTSSSSPNGLKTDLDYLIIYQAHSIGVTEAIKSMTKVRQEGCVVLIGDPQMPNLRVRNPLVRKACGSILAWFYNRDRYPEYFKDDSPCIAHDLACYDYSRDIFDYFNKLFYESQLINSELSRANQFDCWPPLTFVAVQGTAVMYGCSPFNDNELQSCLERIQELTDAGIPAERIGVLTTYCAQKTKIMDRCAGRGVLVGILQDFEDTYRDHLIISTVESAGRVRGGKRYPFSDLLYDKQCMNLALTRGSRSILIVGDQEVLTGIDHWKELLDKCHPRPGKGAI